MEISMNAFKKGSSEKRVVYTIGHSNTSFVNLIRLLTVNLIEVVVDVRSIPYSRYASQFNKDDLDQGLTESGFDYRFAGKYLGAFPGGRKPPEGMEPDYAALSQRNEFKRGLKRLMEISKNARVALLCSEENPQRCHRHHLIAKALLENDIDVIHLRHDGKKISARSISFQKQLKFSKSSIKSRTKRQKRLF